MRYTIKIIDEKKEIIELTNDEIIDIKYKINLFDENDNVNSMSKTELEITGKMLSNIEDSENLYENNKKNLIDLVKWAEAYLIKNEYRDVEIKIELGANKFIEYKFVNMFIYDFFQDFSIEKGISVFKMKLRKLFFDKNKIEIK